MPQKSETSKKLGLPQPCGGMNVNRPLRAPELVINQRSTVSRKPPFFAPQAKA